MESIDVQNSRKLKHLAVSYKNLLISINFSFDKHFYDILLKHKGQISHKIDIYRNEQDLEICLCLISLDNYLGKI